jgi:hypothetical protein
MPRLDVRQPVWPTGILTPEMFGAAGNGVVDDGNALNNLFAAGTDYKLTSGKTYYTTVPLLVPYTCRSFDMTGAKITFTTAGFGTTSSVLTFGDTPHFHNQPSIKGVWVENTGSVGAWSGNNSNVCVRFYNTIAGQIEILYALGATIGVQFVGETAGGVYYNAVNIGRAVNNQVGMDLRSNTAAVGVNQNTFIGGSFKINSSTNVTQDACGIRYSFGSGGYELSDNNIHINFACELSPGGSGVRTPIVMTCGQWNKFENFRAESYTDNIALLSGTNCGRNILRCATYSNYSSGNGNVMADTSGKQSNILEFPVMIPGADRNTGWTSGALANAVYHYNSTDIGIRGVGIIASSTDGYTTLSHVATAPGNTGITPRADFIEIGWQRGVFVEIDTSLHKQFRVWKSCLAGFGGQVSINCFDSSGVLMSGGSDAVGTGFSASGSFYGYQYAINTDSDNSWIFTVSSSVKKIRVIIRGGTLALKLRAFGVQPLSGAVESPISVSADALIGDNPSTMAAATIPTTYGRFRAGAFVQNDGTVTARSTGLMGWTADADGGLAPLWVTATAYAVGDLIYFGTHIYRCSTAGTSGGSGPTGTSKSSPVSDGGASWLYVCELITFTAVYSGDVPIQTGTVSTTDATVTTILTIPITTNSQTTFQVTVAARRTGGSSGAAADGASYIRGVSVKDNAGTPTIIGSSAMMTDQESQAGWDVTFDISTTNLRIRVTGAANNNIDWKATARILSVT